jgi:hypothetical protein
VQSIAEKSNNMDLVTVIILWCWNPAWKVMSPGDVAAARSIRCQWNYTATPGLQVTLGRSTKSGGPYTPLRTFSIETTVYTDLPPNRNDTTYFYQLSGAGVKSNEASSDMALCPICQPRKPPIATPK